MLPEKVHSPTAIGRGGQFAAATASLAAAWPGLFRPGATATAGLTRLRSAPGDNAARPRVLRIRLAPNVRVRREPFGAIVYVPRRDHFFALDSAYANLVRRLGSARWQPVNPEDIGLAATLAELGVCTTDPDTPRRAFFGRSVVGRLDSRPTSRLPLVVNCFATSHCPLRCSYCHADDLMAGYRDDEEDPWLNEVTRVAAATPAMVAVVTGGEPLSRVDRAARLITELAKDKAVVLDTSGVGDFPRLLPLLERVGVHVRVSLDSADQASNDARRPIQRRYQTAGASSYACALDTIRQAVAADLACSVQTVVDSRNGNLADLLELRDLLANLQVTTWVLHIIVPAGKAADPRRSNLRPGPATSDALEELVRRTATDRTAIDIRVTRTDQAPNSVLLISANGELAVESQDGSGKVRLAVPQPGARQSVLRHFKTYVDADGHAGRYLNGALQPFAVATGTVLPRA